MSRGTGLKPIRQCGECSTLFIQPVTQPLAGKVYELCPNPQCHAPICRSEEIQHEAIWWLFNHVIQHSGMGETRRMNLRCIAESQMGPWRDSYRDR